MGKRYACFTVEQQKLFDGLSDKHKKYVLLRGQGNSKTDSYRICGYKGASVRQNSYDLENNRFPFMKELIEALSCQRKNYEVLMENTKIAKKIEEKAKDKKDVEKLASVVPQVPENAPVVEVKDLDAIVDNMSIDQAQNLQFWKQIANGTIKSEKEIRVYDAEGRLKEKKIEKTSTIETRMKAQEKVMRMLNLEEMMTLGQVQANNVNIMIVNASKDEKTVLDEKLELKEEIYESK